MGREGAEGANNPPPPPSHRQPNINLRSAFSSPLRSAGCVSAYTAPSADTRAAAVGPRTGLSAPSSYRTGSTRNPRTTGPDRHGN